MVDGFLENEENLRKIQKLRETMDISRKRDNERTKIIEKSGILWSRNSVFARENVETCERTWTFRRNVGNVKRNDDSRTLLETSGPRCGGGRNPDYVETRRRFAQRPTL